ncbi:hypothetical protein H2248_002939 [Termitomyces sp. 'cryptogamus']|nr:hypothetical protein H2248_002939 [Termitomyces sp. 'cryptogamus']
MRSGGSQSRDGRAFPNSGACNEILRQFEEGISEYGRQDVFHKNIMIILLRCELLRLRDVPLCEVIGGSVRRIPVGHIYRATMGVQTYRLDVGGLEVISVHHDAIEMLDAHSG